MELNQIYNEDREIRRLITQTRLFASVELPVIESVTAGRTGLSVLDIGCNNGVKTCEFFSSDKYSRIIGLEYNSSLVREAQILCRDDRFSFAVCDVERDGFPAILEEQMKLRGVGSFDVIYISLVLMHLRSPFVLLEKIRKYLAPDGHIVITESNDTTTAIASDADVLAKQFVSMLCQDPYAGHRTVGLRLPKELASLGYRDVSVECDQITAPADDAEKKLAVYETYFSYLPPEVEMLRSEFPDEPKYALWADWMNANFDRLRQEVLFGAADVTMGVRVLKCRAPANNA